MQNFAGLILVIFSVILLIGLFLLKDRAKASFRNIPAFHKFNQAIGTAVEDGTGIHFSLGSYGLTNPRTATSFAALSLMRHAAEFSAASDQAPIATSGDAMLAALSQDNLRSAHYFAGAEQEYKASSGRLTGMTPFSYAAGALFPIYDENISTNVLVGGFGVEAGLLSDAAGRKQSFTLTAQPAQGWSLLP